MTKSKPMVGSTSDYKLLRSPPSTDVTHPYNSLILYARRMCLIFMLILV